MVVRLNDLPIRTGHLFIGLAIVMGIITVALLFAAMRGEAPPKVVETRKEVKAEEVVVAMTPILRGEQLSLDNVKTVEWPVDFLPTGAYFESTADVMGRIAVQDMYPGEPVYEQKLAGPDSQGLPAVIPEGLRAVAVKVSEVKGVAGFVKPGDRVDVLATFRMEGDQERTVTVLQNVLVLASAQSMVHERDYDIDTPEGVTRGEAGVEDVPVGEAAEAEAEEPVSAAARKKEREADRKRREKEKLDAQKRAKLVSSVTLGLTPQEAEIVTVAEESASLRLVLRSDLDYGISMLPGVNKSDLIYPVPMLELEEVPSFKVEFIEGTVKTPLSIPVPD